MYTIPKSFDDLSKSAFLILEDLKIFEKNNRKTTTKRESRENNRKISDLLLNNTNKFLFKTANDTSTSINKKRPNNMYLLYDNDKRRKDISVKIKDVVNFSENNDETNKNYFRDSHQKLNKIITDKNNNLTESRRKSSEIKLLKHNGGDSSRYTPKNIKLPRIFLNNDKEKISNKNLYKYGDELKRSVELTKNSILSNKLYK